MSKKPNETLMGNIGHQYYTNTSPFLTALSLLPSLNPIRQFCAPISALTEGRGR